MGKETGILIVAALLCCWILWHSAISSGLTDVELTAKSPRCPYSMAPLNGDPTEHLFQNVAVQRGTPSACISDVVAGDGPRATDFTAFTPDDQMMIDADPVNPAPCVSSKHVFLQQPDFLDGAGNTGAGSIGGVESFGVVNSDPTRDADAGRWRDPKLDFYPNDRGENFNRLTKFARSGELADVVEQPNYPWGYAGGYREGHQNRSPINWAISSMPVVTTTGQDMTPLFPQSGNIPKIDPNLLETLYGEPCHDVYKAVWQAQ